MSTQSGISASPELLDAFKCFERSSLVVKISSDNTQLVPDTGYSSTAQELPQIFSDLHSHIGNEYPQPSYVIVPADGAKSTFIFISFIPDDAPIRQKMLYASTKNTLINSLGSNYFSKNNTFSWTEHDELTIDHYNFVRESTSKPGPLSSDEKVLREINKLQDLTLQQGKSNSSFSKELPSMHGSSSGKVLFNATDELAAEFAALPQNTTNRTLLIFNIDPVTEKLALTSHEQQISVDSLVSALEQKSPPAQPSYSVYNYQDNKFAFIYSCPSGSKVKDRMLYASAKIGLINHLKGLLGEHSLSIDKSLEVGDLDELELSELKDTPAPQDDAARLKFSKPRGPRRR